MNMALTAGCLFLLQCIFLMNISASDPLIEVTPSVVIPGLTSTLDINCTFSLNDPPHMAAFISLVLSRANTNEGNFEKLAAITQFSPDSVTFLTQDNNISATGVHSQTGESFLHLTWQYPTALQAGVYQCSSLGVDNIGYNVELINRSKVTVDKVNVNSIFEKFRQLEEHEASMEQQIQIQNKTISQLQSNVTLLQRLLITDFFLLGSYKNSSYHVSNYAFSNIKKSIDVCKSLGGQLAVVNDQNELTAIQGFLKSSSGFVYVYISGSDEKTEGNWVLSDSDTPLPFTSWYSGTPRTSRNLNCLLLQSGPWTMYDYYCHYDSPSDSIRFMCEI